MWRLQDHLLLAWNLLGRHLGIIRSVGEVAVGSEFISDESREPLETRRARPWADCIVIFGARRSYARKEHYELLWCPNTYDLARGLALCGHSSSPSLALVE